MRLMKYLLSVALLIALLAGCALPTPQPAGTVTPSPSPGPVLPPVVGPEPSLRVAAFYYPWYRTPQVDGYWDHWGVGSLDPPLDIASDFYPSLGTYSVGDPAVVAQHFAWLRAAGVGIIVSSWWGRGSNEDHAVPLLLEIAETYGIQVAFHVEPYGGRTASSLVEDIKYIYDNYGGYPAFYRTTATSRWSPGDQSKGLFYIWAAAYPDMDQPLVEPGYWQSALDTIHALPDGGVVLSDQNASEWVDGGHFDGLYNYGVLAAGVETGYTWARGLPPDAWYVPGVNPGFSAVRIGYPLDVDTPRRDGATYTERWEAALDTGVEPALVTITTFNEWHEGTQIEPAAAGVTNGEGYTYKDYESLPPQGYLDLTRLMVDDFLARTFPAATLLHLRLSTTSDWTTFALVSGASWLRPDVVSVSEEAKNAGMVEDYFLLTQPRAIAEAGRKVEMSVDILFTGWESGGNVAFKIERGHLGSTLVEFSRYAGDELEVIGSYSWGGIVSEDRNPYSFQVHADDLFGAAP